MALRYIDLANEITSSLPSLPIATMGSPLLTSLRKPLHQARVMIVASAGVHLAEDPPFAPINDMTYRRLPTATPASRLRLSHPTPVRRPGEQDIT